MKRGPKGLAMSGEAFLPDNSLFFYCFIIIIFLVGLLVCKNTLGFSILTAQSLGKHKNSWVKSKYLLGTVEAKFSLSRGE